MQALGKSPLALSPGMDGQSGGQIPGEPLQMSPRFALFNTQITRAFKHWDVYLGVENLTNYRQRDPIMGVNDPFGPNFDAAMVWGPVVGRVSYLGFRFRLE